MSPPASAPGAGPPPPPVGDDAALHAQALLAGLQDLRAKARLCDILLTDGRGAQQVAHQVVLAAVSRPLRRYLAEAPSAAAEEEARLGLSPIAPQELRIDGLQSAGLAMEAALSLVYGGPCSVATDAAGDLAAAWGLPPCADAQAVIAGLRELRAQGAMCDLAIIAGGRRFPAHQAVLAAASEPLRRYIMEKMRELLANSEAKGAEGPELVASHSVALDLDGVANSEAVSLVLDYIYGDLGVGAIPLLPSWSVLQEIRQLAASLELPALQARASRWAAPGPRPAGAAASSSSHALQPFASRASLAGAGAAASAGGCEAPDKPAEASCGGEAAAADEEEGDGDEEEEEEEEEAAGGEDEQEASDEDEDKEFERALYAMHLVRFSLEVDIPATPSLSKEPKASSHRRLLQRLREAFDERPVWLDVALMKKLPSADEATLTRLLPYVAYQWIDGPWQKGFTRLGWDPRVSLDEAAPLQVLQFRDPHWKPKDESNPVDSTFRRPPSLRTQWYQLTDIQDDFVQSMVEASELEAECSKKSGWYPVFLLEALKDRLALRSQMLRDRAAKKKAEERASARLSSAGAGRGIKRRSSAAGRGAGRGRVAKKTRTGGG